MSQPETQAETELRLVAAIAEIERLRSRLVGIVSERAQLRGERDRLKAGLRESLRIIDGLDVWNCPVCGSDYEKAQPCDPSCSLARVRSLTDPVDGEG